MTAKRILFAVLCVLLVLVILMFALVLGRVHSLLQSLRGTEPGDSTVPGSSQSGDPSESSGTESTQTQPSAPIATQCPHQYELTDRIEPTCDGYGGNVYTCRLCNHTNMPLDERIDPLGHDYAFGDWVEPTCTEPGYNRYVCTRCQDAVDGDPLEDPLGHVFGDPVEVPATCGEDAHTAYYCQREGCTEVRKENIREGTATGDHTFGPWVPSEDQAEMTHTCQVCGFEETAPYQEQPDEPDGPLGITYSRTETVTGDNSASYTLHLFVIGTREVPDMYTIVIEDYSNNPTLTLTYVSETGPVLRFTDAGGTPRSYSLAKDTSMEITIDTQGNIIG